jgi:hypothetical protein
MIRRHPGVDVEMIEELDGMAGILGGDEVHFL